LTTDYSPTVSDSQPVTSRTPLADLALLMVTLIWGSTFVMVKDAVASYPVFPFLALRFSFAALALLPLALIRRKRLAQLEGVGRTAILRGAVAPLLIGVALFAGYGFQTLGLQQTTPAKAGFITGLAVVIVPLVSGLVLHQAPGRNAWIGVGLALAGLALLTLQAGLHISGGDLLVLACAAAFAAHILLTGRFAPHHDPLTLTMGQILVVIILSGTAALRVQAPPLTRQVIVAAAFTGVLATSAAFGIQTLAQRFTTTTHTALIFAAEPVFAALFSFLLIGEALGTRQLAGCGLILAGMIVAEIKLGGERPYA
jgi:drug/metabolite transporter (DMT)-like permease